MEKQIKAELVYGAFGNGPAERCTGIVEKRTYNKEGKFTKYLGCNYLFKGFPDVNVIDRIAVPKKMIARGFTLLNQKIIQFLLFFPALIFLILPRKQKRKISKLLLDCFSDVSYTAIKKFILPENDYKRPVKEFHRAVSGIANKRLANTLSMCIEYDYAYLARFQDAFQYLNKKKNLKNEFFRIVDILIERDTPCKAKWIAMKKTLKIAWLFKDFREPLKKFLSELNIEEITPDESDFYYVCDRDDYNYGGYTHEERMKIKEQLDKKVDNKLPKITFRN